MIKAAQIAHVLYRFGLTVFILKHTGCRIVAVCAEQLCKRNKEGDRFKEREFRCYSGQVQM